MNTNNWSQNEKNAAGIAAVIGLIVGLVVGYLVYTAARGASSSLPFGYWLTHPLRFSGLWWGLMGAAIGVAVIYVRRLISR